MKYKTFYGVEIFILSFLLLVSCNTDDKAAIKLVQNFCDAAIDSTKSTDIFYPSYKDFKIKMQKDSMVISEDVIKTNDTIIVSGTIYKHDSLSNEPINVKWIIKKSENEKFTIESSNGLVLACMSKSERMLAQKCGASSDTINDMQMNERLPIVKQMLESIENCIKKKISYSYFSSAIHFTKIKRCRSVSFFAASFVTCYGETLRNILFLSVFIYGKKVSLLSMHPFLD